MDDQSSLYSYSYVKKDGNQKGSSGNKPGRKGSSDKGVPFGKKLVRAVVIALVFGLVAGCVGFGSNAVLHRLADTEEESVDIQNATAGNYNGIQVEGTAVSTATTVTDVSDIVENVMPAMVSITNMSEVEYQNWFGQVQKYSSEGCGSGIIVSEDDNYMYIATNNHVVEGATTLTVAFVDDQVINAELKGSKDGADLAVVSVKKADIPQETLDVIRIAVLGDSTSLRLGESAIAIGNALGYGQSVTTGVISALDREVTVQDSSGAAITNTLIQTNAAINPGNSGGALVNMNGEVIGINSVKYTSTEVEGIGYAIPISTAQPIIEELITRETVSTEEAAYLGVSVLDVTEDIAASYNMPQGIYVAQVVSGSAADSYGIIKGDIITSIDNEAVSSDDDLKNILQYKKAGEQVTVVLQRLENGNYEEHQIDVILGKKQ